MTSSYYGPAIVAATIVIAGVAIFLYPATAVAGELRVVDEQGLVRATKEITSPQRLIVELASSSVGVRMTLVNTDGLAPDLTGSSNGAGQVVFDQVDEGMWRLDSDAPVEIRAVRLRDRGAGE